MKLLIIVTRQSGEFDDYWKQNEVNNLNEVVIRNRTVIILNGSKDFNKLKTYENNHFSVIIMYKCNEYFEKNNGRIEEIGIIAHGEQNPNIQKFLDNKYKIAFNRSYTSLDEELCVKEFKAYLCNGTLPLDRLRDTIVDDKCKKKNEFEDAFDMVWNYFLRDPILEAKLELLHMCLTPQGKKNSKKQLEDILSFYKGDSERMSKIQNLYDEIPEEGDYFSKNYIKALEALRDALDLEESIR